VKQQKSEVLGGDFHLMSSLVSDLDFHLKNSSVSCGGHGQMVFQLVSKCSCQIDKKYK
jgi:hypothetical protein